MPFFRRMPVEIEARQFTGDNGLAIQQWAAGCRVAINSGDLHLVIPTLEGDHRANPGDWIIKGVKGEFYPCKPDIFAAIYEAV